MSDSKKSFDEIKKLARQFAEACAECLYLTRLEEWHVIQQKEIDDMRLESHVSLSAAIVRRLAESQWFFEVSTADIIKSLRSSIEDEEAKKHILFRSVEYRNAISSDIDEVRRRLRVAMRKKRELYEVFFPLIEQDED